MRQKNLTLKRWLSVLLIGLLCMAMLSACSTKEDAQESAGTEDVAAEETADAAEDAADEAADAAEDEAGIKVEAISSDQFNAALKDAKPAEEEAKVTLHPADEIEAETEGAEGNSLDSLKQYSASRTSVIYNPIYAAGASSTLTLNGRTYGIVNMLDWDLSTCWAEGNPNTTGAGEAFAYYTDPGSRIDGFTICPGYQKSRKSYRNNYIPLELTVLVGDYTYSINMASYIEDLASDDAYYTIDVTFASPYYGEKMLVRIDSVGTFGKNPDRDCCITEFHPFHL